MDQLPRAVTILLLLHTLSLFPPFLSSPVPFFFPAELFERVVRTPRDVIEKGKPSSLAA